MRVTVERGKAEVKQIAAEALDLYFTAQIHLTHPVEYYTLDSEVLVVSI